MERQGLLCSWHIHGEQRIFRRCTTYMVDLDLTSAMSQVVLPDGSGLEIKKEYLEEIFSEYEKSRVNIKFKRTR